GARFPDPARRGCRRVVRDPRPRLRQPVRDPAGRVGRRSTMTRRTKLGDAPAPPPGSSEFVMGRSAALFRTAVLLTRDPHAAQDLLQTALTKVWRNWDRIQGEPEAYTRRIILNQFLTDRSRRWTG